MKLGNDVLLQLMDYFRQGILEQKDISQSLRDLDLKEQDGVLVLKKHKEEKC